MILAKRTLPILDATGAWAFAALSVSVRPAAASFAYIMTVAQPLENGDAGQYEVHYVTNLLSRGSPDPGVEVRYKCSQDCVQGEGAQPTADLNAAHLAGITIEAEDLDNQEQWKSEVDTSDSEAAARGGVPPRRYYIDTLEVKLDLTRAAQRAARESDSAAQDWWGRIAKYGASGVTAAASRTEEFMGTAVAFPLKHLERLVEEIVDCILDNAAMSRPAVRHLHLRNTGPKRFSRFAKAYSVPSAPRAGSRAYSY